MKSIVELNAELDALKAEARNILATGESENRRLNDTEAERINELSAAITAKEGEIADAEERNKEVIHNTNNNKMEEKKKFSILAAIRGIVNNEQLDEVTQAVINAGRAQNRAAGVEEIGRLIIPTAEARATVSVTGTSGATVPVEVASIFDELRAESVLEKAGATFFNGLSGDVKVPMMTAASVSWEGETSAASDAAASVSGVTLSPKRLTAYMDISKQLLVQDAGSDVEARLMANLVRAINEKFEQTVLGSGAGSSTKPEGLFYNQTLTSTTDWAGVAGLFATVERAKGRVNAIVCSPEAKAAFRAMEYNNKGQLVLDGGKIDGIPCLSTANVAADAYVAGDFRYLAIGTWGGIDLTVDNLSQAGNGAVRLVINVWMDAAMPAAASGVLAFGETA